MRELTGLGPRPGDHDTPPEEWSPLVPVQPLATQGYHVTYHRDCRWLKLRFRYLFGYVLQRAGDGTLLGAGPPPDTGHRRFRISASGDELGGDLSEPPHAHIQDERFGTVRELLPIYVRHPLGRVFVTGDEGDARGEAAVRHGDSGVGGGRYAARDAGDYLEG